MKQCLSLLSSSARRARRRRTAASMRRRSTAITRAIAPVLEAFLRNRTGDVLEIGSGTGQRAVAFASRLPGITWWPTDLNDNHLRSIAGVARACRDCRCSGARAARRQRFGLEALRTRRCFSSLGDVLRQCHSHRAVGCGGRFVRRRRAPSRARRPAVPLRSVPAATAHTTRRAMRRSMKALRNAIRHGACATRRM